MPGAAIRVAARMWLSVAPRSTPPPQRCRCAADADAAGRHVFSPCAEQEGRTTRLHNRITHVVVAALRRAPAWGEARAEVGLDGARDTLRPDLRAVEAATGAVTWGDVSVASPFALRMQPRVVAAPVVPVAAVGREADKEAKYAPRLPAGPPRHAFTPLVWEAYGRVGPATARWLRDALSGPGLAALRTGLRTDVSVALWRTHARAVADCYARCIGVDDPAAEVGGRWTGRGFESRVALGD